MLKIIFIFFFITSVILGECAHIMEQEAHTAAQACNGPSQKQIDKLCWNTFKYPNEYTYLDALKTCADYGWRLPTIEEIYSIKNIQNITPFFFMMSVWTHSNAHGENYNNGWKAMATILKDGAISTTGKGPGYNSDYCSATSFKAVIICVADLK